MALLLVRLGFGLVIGAVGAYKIYRAYRDHKNSARLEQSHTFAPRPPSPVADSWRCAVCESSSTSYQLSVLPNCKHKFHSECLKLVFQEEVVRSCPVRSCDKIVPGHYKI